jgi:SWI/SNF-related matrix-associated actin-dependent regulator of chromatin subfamily A3
MDDVRGGILADDMGLGKTLSMLAQIVRSLPQALDFAASRTAAAPSAWKDLVPSKSTLVVVPSTRKSVQRYAKGLLI